MNKILRDYREKSLDENYIEKWKRLSNRFWQESLLELFKNWKEHLNNKDFKTVFRSKIYNSILEKNHLSYIKSKTYKWLMSLFWKFIHFYDKYQKDLEDNLNSVDQKYKKIQLNVKKEIVDNFDYIWYLKNKFWDDFYKKIDVYLLKNMDPNYSRMIIYIELWNSIKDLSKELKIEINQEDEYIIRRVLFNRYDEEGNVCNDKLSII